MKSHVTIDVSVTAERWRDALPDAERLARQAALAAWQAAREGGPALGREEISIALVDDAASRALNREHRAKDTPTNVLSFALEPVADGDDRPHLLGDVILACETVCREAAEQDKPIADHFCHLVIHGVLHLRGYDHETERDAETMERLETDLLAGLGIDDPYRIAETVI